MYINIAFLLIVNKPQPNLHPGHTCLGLGGIPQTDCSVANPGKWHGGPGGPGGAWSPPIYFKTKLRHKGLKKFFDAAPPPLSQGWMTAPPPLI